MCSFCSYLKKTFELDIVLTRTVNILTTNELVKLTMLWKSVFVFAPLIFYSWYS